MTKTELIQHQRRFEWDLARDEQTRAAAKLVAGKTHDLLNLVQIVKLASGELAKRCDPTGQEFIDDLLRAAQDAEVQLKSLMRLARPERTAVRGPAVGASITHAIEELRPSIPIDLHLAIDADTASALSADELAYLVFGLALDAAASPRIELFVRDRIIDDVRWIEIVRGADVPAAEGEPSFDLRSVELVVARAGGELSCSERRGGGSELVVALPAISASA
jgi:signal transduction histidine kinase